MANFTTATTKSSLGHATTEVGQSSTPNSSRENVHKTTHVTTRIVDDQRSTRSSATGTSAHTAQSAGTIGATSTESSWPTGRRTRVSSVSNVAALEETTRKPLTTSQSTIAGSTSTTLVWHPHTLSDKREKKHLHAQTPTDS